jgi:predicted DNA-binding ribbon-helix-helix protein
LSIPNGRARLKGRRAAVKSRIVIRSILISGHKTSVSLEDAFWTALKTIAAGRKMTVSDLVWAIDVRRQRGNLSSAIRLFILDSYRARLGARRWGVKPNNSQTTDKEPTNKLAIY